MMKSESNYKMAACAALGIGLLAYGFYRWRSHGLDRRTKIAGLAGIAALAGAYYFREAPPLPHNLPEKLAVLSKRRSIPEDEKATMGVQIGNAAVEYDLNMLLACEGWSRPLYELLAGLEWNSHISKAVRNQFSQKVLKGLEGRKIEDALLRAKSTWVLPKEEDLSRFGFVDDVEERLDRCAEKVDFRDGYRAIRKAGLVTRFARNLESKVKPHAIADVLKDAELEKRDFSEDEIEGLSLNKLTDPLYFLLSQIEFVDLTIRISEDGVTAEDCTTLKRLRNEDRCIGGVNVNPEENGVRSLWSALLNHHSEKQAKLEQWATEGL